VGYLNSRYELIHDEVISVGSLTANIVHPREVFQPAIAHAAAAIIIAHNHPSGTLAPTQADLDITAQLRAAGAVLGIELLDHLIVTQQNYYSILEDHRAP
jgi:DNA repair protein RadC